ncbi:MAG: peptidase, partial [Caulobacteraceae bacterium]|nr:peptidase [Caulobacteraceae bacterium]
AKAAPPKAPKPGAALDQRYIRDVMMFAAASEDPSVTVGKGDTLQKIARKAGVSIDDLAKANNLKPPYRLNAGQTLALPGAAASGEPAAPTKTKAKGGKTPAKAEPKAAPAAEPVTVGKGDTLQKIAKKAGVSIDDLAQANNLKPPYRLNAGQKLALPGAAPSDQPAAASSAKPASGKPAAAKAAPRSVKVGRGDTLASLADKAGVSQAELARLNHLKKPYRLRRGQTIKLPAGEAAEAAPSSAAKAQAPQSVTVGKGQTLQAIADDAGVPVAELARLNHLKKPYRVKAGQRIRLPADGAPTQAAPAPRAEAPRVVTAGRRDTLQSIADKAGVPVAELARLNHLKKPYRLKRGQKIKLPGRAPATASSAASYTVKRGDTLYSIARRFGTDARTLAEANGLDVGAHVNVGRRLQLPGGPLDRPAPRSGFLPSQPAPYSSLPSNPPTAPAPGLAPPPGLPPAQSAPPITAPYSRPQQPAPTPAPRPEASTPSGASDADVAAAGRGFFQQPVRGTLLSGYGAKAGGQRNDGLDIAAPAGEPVHAAAAGEIVYAGNSVPGFGNLVLIRHEGGWVTAYAHLSNIDVKMRQTVVQGQQIGEVGQSGGVDQPQLHFEVRYAPSNKDKARPIDPSLVLPQ